MEGTWGNMKNHMRKQNSFGRGAVKAASQCGLAARYQLKHPGMAALGTAMREYFEKHKDEKASWDFFGKD